MSAPGHWNMSENIGSEPCNCDPEGSFGIDCNELTGQCECKPGRGGRTCSECEDLYYGDPTEQCYPCDCDPQGSAQEQCDRRTGQCVCRIGISGFKCDRCDRGTTGELPNCVPCGDCFDNWDRMIRSLRGKGCTPLQIVKKILNVLYLYLQNSFISFRYTGQISRYQPTGKLGRNSLPQSADFSLPPFLS